MKRVSFLLYLGAAALAVVVLYSAYVFWQKSASADQVAVLTGSVTDYQAKILEKENAQIVQAINAKQTVISLKAGTIEWSKAINNIRATVPKDGAEPIAQILSYSGSSASDVALNMKTVSGSENPYLDVAAVIKSFTDSPLFADAFVPSISAGTDQSGSKVLSFTLSAKYLSPKAEAELPKEEKPELGDTVMDVIDESVEGDVATPVSR